MAQPTIFHSNRPWPQSAGGGRLDRHFLQIHASGRQANRGQNEEIMLRLLQQIRGGDRAGAECGAHPRLLHSHRQVQENIQMVHMLMLVNGNGMC